MKSKFNLDLGSYCQVVKWSTVLVEIISYKIIISLFRHSLKNQLCKILDVRFDP